MKALLFLILLGFMINCSAPNQKQSQSSSSSDPKENHIVVNSTQEAIEFYSWTTDRIPLVSAHRGGPYPGFPENSLEAFENVLRHTPAIIEFDVSITKDSVLVLMHDITVDRTTTGTGKVSDLTFEEIRELNLVDKNGDITDFRVPTLDEALEWGKNKALFTIDVKREVPFELVVDAIKKHQAENYAAVITYSLEAATKIHYMHPDLMLSVTIRNNEELERFDQSRIPIKKIIAFTGTSARSIAFNEIFHRRGVYTILGVMGNLDNRAIARGDEIYAGLVKGGVDILATDRPIEAAEAIQKLKPKNSSKEKYFR